MQRDLAGRQPWLYEEENALDGDRNQTNLKQD